MRKENLPPRHEDDFNYSDERFSDIQLLRYRLNGYESLSAHQRILLYYLSEATLCGRDITFDQFCKYNLRIRKMLEAVYLNEGKQSSSDSQFCALEVYLKRMWFSNGIHHHYGCEKFQPEFSKQYLHECLLRCPTEFLHLRNGENIEDLEKELFPVIFNPEVLPKRVNKADGVDLIQTSACNYYEQVTQQEVETYYAQQKQNYEQTATDRGENPSEPPSFGLNTTLVKENGSLREVVWKADGKYGPAIQKIIYWLEKAQTVAESDRQRNVIRLLIDYYRTGDLKDFDRYSIEWVKDTDGRIDFVNGFIEVYGDPLGLKASWEGIVEYKDLEATKRTQAISQQAQWFEDHSPVDPRFRKPHVKGVTANAICAAMLGGDEYPSTAIGINLPNADWIRAHYGSKSVTITNLTQAYDEAAKGTGFREEFVIDEETLSMVNKWSSLCGDLHTDLHECLGHGSGRLLPGVDPDALKNYGNTIEEARADLFGLYYIADEKLLELGLLSDAQAYRSQYYTYLMNGLMTQLVRIQKGNNIEEAHMRNRALIAHWVLDNGDGVVELVKVDGKGTCVRINDYQALRGLFARLLAEIQRIKSEGDYEAARELVETYAVRVNPLLHEEVLCRYQKLDLAPYKGFINPIMKPVYNAEHDMIDVELDYTESYTEQMLRYGREYGFL